MIFKQYNETGVFPSESKKGNIAPIHKKGDKQKTRNLSSSVVVTCMWKDSWKITV